MPNISSYGKAGKKGTKSPNKRAGSSAQATMRRQQADLEKRRAQRKTPNKGK